MVAKVASGKHIRGALDYNENKVEQGKAILINAVNYPKDCRELSAKEKLKRLTNQADLNERVEHKCVHISLNFEPTEHFTKERFNEIAEAYMEKMGFGDQPYLVYEHTDVAHSHLHIVTTSIRANGERIPLHNIGEKLSEPARKAIETAFNLIPAKSKKPKNPETIKPADLQKAFYGKSETKATISNIVRSVFKDYKYTSFAEFNTILEQFNIKADRGDPGTSMYEKEGLNYWITDPKGNKLGVSIKASSIYESPTLKQLKKRFEKNERSRERYKARVCRMIDDILAEGVDKENFKNALCQSGINAVFRTNDAGQTYGITFIDHETCCVFNGSDLGKSYSARNILPKLNATADQNNAQQIRAVIGQTNYEDGLKTILANWARNQIGVKAEVMDDGTRLYFASGLNGKSTERLLFTSRLSHYFYVNDFSPERANNLYKILTDYLQNTERDSLKSLSTDLHNLIEDCFSQPLQNDYISSELLKEARKKARRRGG